MSNAIISYPDYTKTATLSGGSWDTLLSLNNLKESLLSKKARSLNLMSSSTTIKVDLGASRDIRCIGVLSHNISFDGTITVTGHYDNSYNNPIAGAYMSSWAWSHALTSDSITNYPKNWIGCFSAPQPARYWKVVISDTYNSAGYIELGRLWIGEATFEPTIGISYDASLGYESRDILEESLGGIVWGEKRSARRIAGVSFSSLSNAEKNKALIMQKVLSQLGEVLWVMNSTDTDEDMVLQAFPATVRSTSPLNYPYLNNYDTAMEFQEIL